MKRLIKTSGGPITKSGGKLVTELDIGNMHKKIRDFLINNGFGLCSRGPITFDWLAILYGKQRVKKYWHKKWKEEVNKD